MSDGLKVLMLSRYDRSGPSSRVRLYQYIDALREAGIEVTPAPLFGTGYIKRLYTSHSRGVITIVRAYMNRLLALARQKRYDLLWVEYELLPWLPAAIERLCLRSSAKYVLELDDAVFHRYDLHPLWAVRALLGDKIDMLMRNSSAVIAGNAYLAARASASGASCVKILPTAVDVVRYQPAPRRQRDSFIIGWIGSPSTDKYLAGLQPALARVCRHDDVRVVAVGAGNLALDGVRLEVRGWSEAAEVEEIQSFDVGIMPLTDGPWERGKCGFKIIQYQACGVPVVASPVGANRDIIVDGVNGLLASDTEEWVRALDLLRSDGELRRRLGSAGRESVCAKYSTAVVARDLIKLFKSFEP